MLVKIKIWFQNKIIKLIIKKHFKLWGIRIEVPGIDNEFIITHHAYTRMLDRVGCHEDKIKKLAIKSWYSTNKIDPAAINRKQYKYTQIRGAAQNKVQYRSLMGYTFIWQVNFVDGAPQKKLITVY